MWVIFFNKSNNRYCIKFECSCYTDGAKKGGFLPSIHMLTPYNFKKNKMRTKHPVFFFFFSSSPVLPHLSSDGTHHLRRCSSFLAKPNRKTQTQPQKSILMPQKSFLMPQNSILMPQKSFLDSKLKPRF
jgi:hypothetical protein